MCNEYEFQAKYDEYVEVMRSVDIGPPEPTALPSLASIRIGDAGPVLRAIGNGVELALMKFGFPPPRPKAGPVFNYRSEGRHFGQSHRCLIPATAFFEFTGAKYPKTRHRLWMPALPFFAIAGLWRPGDGGDGFTMLTTEPGPDIAPIHDRQIVILRPEQWAAWLWLTQPEAELLRPLPAGSLQAEIVRAGKSASDIAPS